MAADSNATDGTELALPRLRSAAGTRFHKSPSWSSEVWAQPPTPRGRARERPGDATGSAAVELSQALVMQPTSGSSRGWKPRTSSFTPRSPTQAGRYGNACNIVCENRRLKAVALFANEGLAICCHWRWLRFGHRTLDTPLTGDNIVMEVFETSMLHQSHHLPNVMVWRTPPNNIA
jgi:hypothetical protein